MDILVVISVVIAILAAGAGIGVALRATGLFEYIGGKKKPQTAPLSKPQLQERILGLNSSSLPYEIKPARGTDYEIEWKIVDAKWLGVFATEGIRRTYRALMVLDEARYTVRYWESLANVEWVAGAPKVHFQSEFFRGRILFQKSYGVQYGIKPDGTPGKVYEYKYDINALRDPLKKTVEDGGWEFVPVLMKKHALLRGSPR